MAKKIYLIEDDAAIIDIYQMVLEKAGFEVQVISTGEEVMKKVKGIQEGQEPKPDLVLLDLILPDMHGTEILKEIRKNEATKGMVVFILSNQQPTELNQLGDVKPDKFIIKANITPTDLLATIQEELT